MTKEITRTYVFLDRADIFVMYDYEIFFMRGEA